MALKPVNANRIMGIMFSAVPQIQAALNTKGEITVAEAIDIVATVAHATAVETGVADTVIAVSESRK